MIETPILKPLEFLGDSLKRIRGFRKDVRYIIGQALWAAQLGKTHPDAKPLKGFKGSGVVEIVADSQGDTYRGVYTVKLAGVVYVLHAFQKKSKSGVKTLKREIEMIEARLKTAEAHYRKNTLRVRNHDHENKSDTIER